MRRTLSLLVVATSLVALTGVASASGFDLLPGRQAAPRDEAADSTGPEIHGRDGSAGSQTVGRLVQVARTVAYGPRQRSATFSYPGADYVKVHLKRLLLLPGDYVTVADRTGAESYTYRGTGGAGLLASDGDRWAMSVTGDTAVVTLHPGAPDPMGLRGRLPELGVQVDRVARGHTPAERRDERRRDGREESLCGGDDKADSVCYRHSHPVVFRNTRAVARLLINGTELCTGWRVGPQNRLLTNHHCFSHSEDAYNTEVWFNYRCAACGGFEVVRPTKVWGDKVLASNRVLDYTLFTVEEFERVSGYGFLELDNRRSQPEEKVYIPQHPGGDPTMVAMESDADPDGACRIKDPAMHGYEPGSDSSYYCDTEGGSSGSPVVSATTHKVVALHHFGGCPNSGVRADLIHAEVARLL